MTQRILKPYLMTIFLGLTSCATVYTTMISNITQTSATGGGDVVSQLPSFISVYGICWSTTPNPSRIDNHTIDGSGTGNYTSNLTGLAANTQYYVRAYAENWVTYTVYGEEKTFRTDSLTNLCPGIPTVTYEGKTYNTVAIGNQCWFRENLNVGKKIDNSLEQINNGVKEKYCWGGLESFCDVYGGLYQWDEAMQYTTQEGAQGICPNGWHIPTEAEWATLSTFLGGDNVSTPKLEEAGFIHWTAIGCNYPGTNSSGFTGLPGGCTCQDNSYANLTSMGLFWTSSQNGNLYAWLREMQNSFMYFYHYGKPKTYGFSLRCILN